MAEDNVLQRNRGFHQSVMAAVFLAILLGGWRYPVPGYFVPACMLAGIGIGLYRGRKWCDWYCPRGSFFDVLIGPISPKKGIPKFFKGLPFRICMLSFLMLLMALQIIKRWPDPYKMGMFFMVLITTTTVLGVFLALIFHQRVWCCFCPIGTMANWAGRQKYPLKMDCKLCRKVCPVQIEPFKFKGRAVEKVGDGDCLKCNLCVQACPKKALSF